ncbi:hypothetical protein CWB89_16495 [Pseudoalteromonas piscicida]|uniref:Uncharacterized protein n=1 Tax=Pseudoalteromonas piscicida TaxID=43662 RepID=A0AAQ2EQK2_PSEO7|nr:hypothetical protein TW75_04205 [Pseudoalteromonas piscicida]TMN77649.1 hypothetical protein CWB87_17530 [Pseudoalteromonas flavipulchra]TMN37679.1 hypothetical protein CWB94_15750 [Pseudoalteromonas piscicida]TMN45899.1 hypothetical protein CWB95_00075 [Pseudoalteromonas piscicida]TMN47606.1 hypothetical protein CWB91_21175 [Pseudoalteromonas piscicida]
MITFSFLVMCKLSLAHTWYKCFVGEMACLIFKKQNKLQERPEYVNLKLSFLIGIKAHPRVPRSFF